MKPGSEPGQCKEIQIPRGGSVEPDAGGIVAEVAKAFENDGFAGGFDYPLNSPRPLINPLLAEHFCPLG
jgi:hypothetical protein